MFIFLYKKPFVFIYVAVISLFVIFNAVFFFHCLHPKLDKSTIHQQKQIKYYSFLLISPYYNLTRVHVTGVIYFRSTQTPLSTKAVCRHLMADGIHYILCHFASVDSGRNVGNLANKHPKRSSISYL